MCWANKCCYILRLDHGCLAIGVFSFVSSAIVSLATIALLCLEDKPLLTQMKGMSSKLGFFFEHNIPISSTYIILGLVLLLAVLEIMFSVLLILGVYKNRPSFVLSFFAYGIVLTIVLMLGALLELLETSWKIALVQGLFALLYIHFLVVVHTVYELMQRGKQFGSLQHELLIES